MLCALSALMLLAAAVSATVAPNCVESIVPITASGVNFDLSSGTRPPNATVPVSGTFGVQLRYCEPAVSVPGHESTLQVLVHGVTYNLEYWDISFQPEMYSYVRFAAAQGYATLNMARLGT